MTNTLGVGDRAPDFVLVNDEYKDFALSSQLGKNVVLYFYPKDNTPGCTQQAIEFTELMEEFVSANTVILGMSKDDAESHEHFKKAKCISFTLLSDTDATALEDYGVWVLKNMYGKEYMGIERSTFIINKEGKIHKIWRKVKVKGHAREVLEEVKKMK
jgi:peroxiredoxin Q/BCP